MNDIYVGSLFSEAYLEHHGILGMKWGVRRFQNKDGSLTPAGKKRKISNENKREETRKAVRDYSKKYNKASKASDDADELWRDAKSAYKNTGKTGITRVINNATKGKFADSQTKKAISEYSKKYDKASKASDDADELWRDAKSAYKSTGKNALSRVANNIKYDPDREKRAAARKQEKELKKKELAANVHNKAHEYDRKKNWHEAYNKATDEFNTRINGINAKYTGKNLGKNFETKDGQKYVTEVGKMWKDVYSKAAVDRFGTTLSVSSDGSVKEGRDFVNNMPFMNQYDEFIKR